VRYGFTVLKLGFRWRRVVSFTPLAPLPLEEQSPVHILSDAGWVPDPVWTLRRKEKSLAPAGNRVVAKATTIIIAIIIIIIKVHLSL
jgi:hypothetical protein